MKPPEKNNIYRLLSMCCLFSADENDFCSLLRISEVAF